MDEGRRGRRSSYEIIGDIILAASESAKVTDIVYGARLNFTIVHKYLDHLMEAGLLRRAPDGASYEATEKGLEYLEAFHRVKKILSVVE